MAITFYDRQIKRVCILDDDDSSRNVLKYTVEDSDLEALPQNEGISDINFFLSSIKNSDAIVSDHHLRKKNYFPADGAVVCSHCYDLLIPSILVTKWEQADVHEIRKLRPKIPVIINPEDFNPDSLIHSLEICINEFKGVMIPQRKTWRTLVRIDDLDELHFYVIIPSWNPNEVISIAKKELDNSVAQSLRQGQRVHANVNIEAKQPYELFFQNWEI